MPNLTYKFSRMALDATVRVITFALFLVVFGASAAFAQTKAYVTNVFSSTVSVIDTTTNTVVATVPVGTNPFGVAVTPNGAFVYVANFLSQNVSVIDAATNTVVATVLIGGQPI